jgi:hypothetical protein
MKSKLAFLVVGLFSAAAHAHDEPAAKESATTVAATAEPDRISRIAAKFHDSVLLFDQSVTPDTLNSGAQLSQVPSYQWWFSFRPRYYVTPKFSLRLRMDLITEWLAGAETTYAREGQFGDIWTDGIYELPHFAGIVPTIGLRGIWGTSKEALGATSVVKLGPTIGFKRTFEGTKIGDWDLTVGAYLLYNFVKNPSGATQSAYGCASTDFGPTSCTTNTGKMDGQVNLVTSLAVKYTPKWVPALTLSTSYSLLKSWDYATPDITLMDATGGTTVVPHNQYDTRLNESGWFLASIEYDVTKYASLSLGYYCLRPVRDPNGSVGNPFYQPGGASRIFLTLTFTLDQVYEAIARKWQHYKGRDKAATATLQTTTVSDVRAWRASLWGDKTP